MITATRWCPSRLFMRRQTTTYPWQPLALKSKESPPLLLLPPLGLIRIRSGISGSIRFIQHHSRWKVHHLRASRLSTISSSPLSFSSSSSSLGKKTDPLVIEVTVTSSAEQIIDIEQPTKINNYNININNNNNNDYSNTAVSSSSSGTSSNHNSKSPDQIAEEEILSIQSELRVHFRHAAYETALETASRLLSRTTTQFGTLHPATASAYNNLGLMNKCLGKYVEAKDAYHEALRIYGEVCGKDHASYAAALSNLGMLERGRVLESEGAADDDNEEEGDGVNNEDGVDLEALLESNKHVKPTKLSALDRIQLNETAIEYFDEAYRIRHSELGSSHPHTIASRSQLGAAMAAAVIAERRGQVGGLLENELRKLKLSKNVRDAKEMETYVPEALAKAASKTTLSGSKLTRRRWEAAEEHLRGALTTAVENPRGESVHPLIYIPIAKRHVIAERISGRQGFTLPPKEDKSGLSKKEKKLLGKERLREKRRANSNAKHGNEGDMEAVIGVAAKVTTLSAATAAQNLAVFLKNYSDWIRLSLINDDKAQQPSTAAQMLNDTIHEAKQLYESALHVRSSILPSHHPDVIATKFSLAELYDSPRVSDSLLSSPEGERANQLRDEILNSYNVEEREDSQ